MTAATLIRSTTCPEGAECAAHVVSSLARGRAAGRLEEERGERIVGVRAAVSTEPAAVQRELEEGLERADELLRHLALGDRVGERAVALPRRRACLRIGERVELFPQHGPGVGRNVAEREAHGRVSSSAARTSSAA